MAQTWAFRSAGTVATGAAPTVSLPATGATTTARTATTTGGAVNSAVTVVMNQSAGFLGMF